MLCRPCFHVDSQITSSSSSLLFAPVGTQGRGSQISSLLIHALMIYCCSSWYDEHLKECEGGNDEELRIRIVLLTNDRANREKAKKEGIISFTGMMEGTQVY